MEKERKSIIGVPGTARTDIQPRGEAFIRGETWQVRSYNNEQIRKGDRIQVVDIKNLLLIVSKTQKR
ncbi:MAG: NfeD family protein [bacterium]|nr:NfeD family protein [bacterium]